MRFYKWLIGLVTAIFYTLIIAWFSSFFFKIDVNWFNLLNKPSFMPNIFVYELCETISYVLISIVLARLIVNRKFGLQFIFIILDGVFSILFIMTFFYFQQIYIATAIIAIIFALSITISVLLFMRDSLCAIVYFPIALWHSFLFILAFVIALHN